MAEATRQNRGETSPIASDVLGSSSWLLEMLFRRVCGRTAAAFDHSLAVLFFVSSALVDIICRRSQLPVRKTKARESVKSCTEKVKRHTQGVCSARKEHRSGWRLQVQGPTQEARPVEAGSQRYLEDAGVLEGRSRGGSPKLERSALQAAVYSGSPGRTRSSCEQAPAYY